MAGLIAIGYPDETTADAAADEARRLAQDLIISSRGVAVAALIIPKNLGYAGIAGIPLQNGRYAAAVGAILYAVFGTSQQICQTRRASVRDQGDAEDAGAAGQYASNLGTPMRSRRPLVTWDC